MEIHECSGVILTSYHSFGPSRIHMVEESFTSPLSPGQPPINRRVCYLGPGRMASQEAVCLPLSRCRSTQDILDSPECRAMQDYWTEKKSIEEEGHGVCEEPTERRSIDEVELEEAWLHEAGLSTLVSGTSEDDGPAEALLSTLTRSQAALVKKRVDNYTQTMRIRNKQPVRHVRDVFPSGDPAPSFSSDVVYSINPKPPVPPRLPHWVPVRGGENLDYQQRRETLSFEAPYSEEAANHKKEKICQDCQRLRSHDGIPPTFQTCRPKLGLTRVQDLSLEDMKKIGCIALIELSTFYDCLGIELKRPRTVRLRSRADSGIFGVPLTTLLENDQKKSPGLKVPLVFKKLLSKLEQTGLQTEGILRVPGSASRVKQLKQELEAKFYDGNFDWEQVRHNDAAGLLKMFIRELPMPLLTLQHLPAFSAVQNIPWPKHQIQALHLLIMLLPEPHRDTLKALLEFLSKVVAHEEKNRMGLCNVSMIVAPNLFISCGKISKPEEIQGAAGEAHLVRLLITHQELLWTVPCFLISQVRRMNEASMGKKTPTSEKTRKKLWKKQTERDKTEKSDLKNLREGVIRVHAPEHAKVSMAIQLNSETKAKDVMGHFQMENGRTSRSNSRKQRQYLFEVGGNIGERCLDPETFLQDLYRVNPGCEWILKPRTI